MPPILCLVSSAKCSCTAGYRLAKWLDLIAANDATRKRDVEEGREPAPLPRVSAPPKPDRLSRAKMARRATGYNCNHAH